MKWFGEVSGGSLLATMEEDVMVWPRGLTMWKHARFCACPDLELDCRIFGDGVDHAARCVLVFLLFHQMQKL